MARRYPYYGQYGPRASPGYNPYSKHPDWAGSIRELLKNMQMMKQLKEEKEQRVWERGQREEQLKMTKQRANLALKELSEDIRGRELEAKERLRFKEEAKAELTPEQYKRWKYKLPAAGQPSVSREKFEEAKKYISPRKEAFISGLISDAGKRLNAYTRNVQYGRSPDLDKRVKNLNSAIQFWRSNLAIGTERKLETEEWADILKSSDLDKLEQSGKHWERKAVPSKKKGVAPWKNAIDVELGGETLQLSPSKKLLWDGTRIIPQNPDGTFTIGGKKYKLG